MKQNFDFLGLKVINTTFVTFSFHSFSSPLHSLFLLIFFFFCWAFSRLQFGGNALGKAPRVLGLGERASPCTKLSLTIKTDNVTSW